MEEEGSLLTWLLGLQQLIVYFSPDVTVSSERWTLPKLQLQKLRLKVSGESDRTGQGPFDVVLSAVLDAAQDKQKNGEKATVLQAAWRRRNVQGKFQQAVGEMMEINGLIEGLEEREKELEERQAVTALKIEKAMKLAEMDEPPPKMPSDKDMADPKKMQEYMLQMGEYSARQRAWRGRRQHRLVFHWLRHVRRGRALHRVDAHRRPGKLPQAVRHDRRGPGAGHLHGESVERRGRRRRVQKVFL